MVKQNKASNDKKVSVIQQLMNIIHSNVLYLNSSKVFAGIVVIILNISGKFVNVKLSKSIESYLKHTFSRDIFIFCVVWMGSRDIYTSLIFTAVFILFMDFLFNENSSLCILPESFTKHHIELIENQTPTPEEIQNAKRVLQAAEEKNQINSNLSTDNIIPSSLQNDSVTIKW